MMEFSSFMVPWNAIFSIFSGSSLIASVALFFLISKAKGKLALQDIHCTADTFWGGLIVTGLCSIIAVLLLQVVANTAFNMAFAGEYSTTTLRAGAGIARNKGALAILVVTLLIGGGYAFSFVDASLMTHMASCTIGIGVLEEGAKCIAALLVFSMFYKGKGIRYSLSPFVIAGLGFGGGEALHYFATYNLIESGFMTYIIRAWWCVPLHAAWAIIAGERIIRSFQGVPSLDALKGDDYWKLLGCLLPSIILHGVYDAFCFHNIPLSWVVGIASLIWGFKILSKPKEQFAGNTLPPTTPT
jgi:RsiW-degrading membrane proteinase PrsW (M82 family)